MEFLRIFLAVLAIVAVASAEFHTGDKSIDARLNQRFAGWNHLTYKTGDAKIFDAPSRNIVDDKIIAFLEELRVNFTQGFPDAGIPPLDPFVKDNTTFHIGEKNIFKANVTLEDILLKGASTFIIENIKFKIVGLSLEFGFIVPDLSFTSKFDVDGKVAVIIPFKPNGDISIGLKGLNITGKAALATKEGGFLFVKTIDMEFNVDSTKVQLDNILDIEFFNNVLNWILDQLSDDFFEGQKEALAIVIGENLVDIVNGFLEGVSLPDLIG